MLVRVPFLSDGFIPRRRVRQIESIEHCDRGLGDLGHGQIKFENMVINKRRGKDTRQNKDLHDGSNDCPFQYGLYGQLITIIQSCFSCTYSQSDSMSTFQCTNYWCSSSMLSLRAIISARAFPYSFFSFLFKTRKYSESSSEWSSLDPVIIITRLMVLSTSVGCFSSSEVPSQYLRQSSLKYLARSNFLRRRSATSSSRAVQRKSSTLLVCRSDSMKATLLIFLSFMRQQMAPAPNSLLRQWSALSRPLRYISSQMNRSFLVVETSTKMSIGQMAMSILDQSIRLLSLLLYFLMRRSRWWRVHFMRTTRKKRRVRMNVKIRNIPIQLGAYYYDHPRNITHCFGSYSLSLMHQ